MRLVRFARLGDHHESMSHMVVAIDGTGTVVFGRLGDHHESMETVFM